MSDQFTQFTNRWKLVVADSSAANSFASASHAHLIISLLFFKNLLLTWFWNRRSMVKSLERRYRFASGARPTSWKTERQQQPKIQRKRSKNQINFFTYKITKSNSLRIGVDFFFFFFFYLFFKNLFTGKGNSQKRKWSWIVRSEHLRFGEVIQLNRNENEADRFELNCNSMATQWK